MTKQQAPEPRRRHTLSDAYEQAQETIAALLTRTPRQPSESVELTRNAKGDVQIAVSAGSHEGETLEECAARARATFDTLCTAYPRTVEQG